MPIKTGKPTYWIYTHCYSDCRLHPTVALLLHQMQQQQLEAQRQQAAQIQLTRALERLSTRPITVTNPPNPPRLPPPPPPLREGIAAEADLACFEKHMTAYDVPRTRWTAELRTLLQGDLTSVTLSISTDQAGCYSTLKKAILTRLGITQSAWFSAWLDPNPRSSETLPGLPPYPRCCPYLSQILQQHRILRYSNHAGSCLQPAATVGGTVRTRTEATYSTGHGPSSGCWGRRRKIWSPYGMEESHHLERS